MAGIAGRSGGAGRKTRQQHKLAGTFRSDRHAELHDHPEKRRARYDVLLSLFEKMNRRHDWLQTQLDAQPGNFRADRAARACVSTLIALGAALDRIEATLPNPADNAADEKSKWWDEFCTTSRAKAVRQLS
jgi:hypothetical protein